MQSPVVFPTLASSIDIKTRTWYDLPATPFHILPCHHLKAMISDRISEVLNTSTSAMVPQTATKS